MNTASTDIFDVLIETKSDPTTMLDRMVQHLRQTRQPMELFEALKMRTRHGLELSLLPSADEPSCPEQVERQLESGLLDACRETGTMLIEDGKVGEGWMYLRPTGDLEMARDLIKDVPIDDDNYDQMIAAYIKEATPLDTPATSQYELISNAEK